MGDSNRSRKASARELHMHERHGVWKLEQGLSPPEISFGPEDNQKVIHPHDDALVITVEVERYQIQRVFVDTGAAVNVIFESCFNQMSLQKPLNGVTTALHGFSGDPVTSLGSIDLMLTLGEGFTRVSKPVTFLVVRQPSSYNIILGRTALNPFQAVVSTYYLMMKFPVGNQVGQISGDQEVSRKCYVQSVQAGEARKRPMAEPTTEEAEMKLEGKRLKALTPAKESQNLSVPMEHLLITSHNPPGELMISQDLAKQLLQQIDEREKLEAEAANICHAPIVKGQGKALIAQAKAKVKSAMEALDQENAEETTGKEKGITLEI